MSLFGDVSGVEYRCLLADPPWQEHGGGNRGAQVHYPTMTVSGIVDAIRGSGEFRPAQNAHFWCWVTDNFLVEGLEVLRLLGFRYVRTACWVKAASEEALAADDTDIGLGQYLRGAHELLLLGVRGRGMAADVRTDARDVRSVCYGRRTRHSAKPLSSYQLIERVSCGPRVEFFARRPRAGWTTFGNDPALSEAAE